MRSRAALSAMVLGSTVAVACAVLALAGLPPRSPDDAYIVLVYARHLGENGSIYWNAGEGHVDGYTSVLDMVLKAALLKVLPKDPIADIHVLSIVLFVLSVLAGAALAYQAVKRDEKWAPWIAALAAVAFGTDLALVDATRYLLETPLFATVALVSLNLLFFAPLERRGARVALAIAWVLLALSRPEGGPIALLELLGFVWLRRSTLARRALLEPCAIFGVAIVAYYAWHLAYFGWLAPNTYYAKASDSRWMEVKDGVSYLGGWLKSPARGVSHVMLLLIPFTALVRRIWRAPLDRAHVAIAGGCGLLRLATTVYSGGDGYPGARLLAVGFICLLAAAALAAQGLVGRWRALALVPLAVFVAEGLSRILPHPRERLARVAEWPYRYEGKACERGAIQLIAKRVDNMSQTDMQRAKFYVDDLRVIDLTALNDMKGAHSSDPGQDLWGKTWASDVTGGADVAQLGTRSWVSVPWSMFSSEEIGGEERFAKELLGWEPDVRRGEQLAASYRPMSIATCGLFFNVFVRADRADRFAHDRGVFIGAARKEP